MRRRAHWWGATLNKYHQSAQDSHLAPPSRREADLSSFLSCLGSITSAPYDSSARRPDHSLLEQTCSHGPGWTQGLPDQQGVHPSTTRPPRRPSQPFPIPERRHAPSPSTECVAGHAHPRANCLARDHRTARSLHLELVAFMYHFSVLSTPLS